LGGGVFKFAETLANVGAFITILVFGVFFSMFQMSLLLWKSRKFGQSGVSCSKTDKVQIRIKFSMKSWPEFLFLKSAKQELLRTKCSMHSQV
jgi:hypothetical protein